MSLPTVAAHLAVCRAELGKVEDPPGSNRTPYAACAGHANGYAWCATFQVCMARRSGLVLPSESAYTPTMANAFKAAGRWGPTPRPGALGFLYNPNLGRIAHVWIVEAVEPDGTQITIEGNAQPMNSLVLTPTGWAPLGSLRPGMRVVDPEGHPSEIVGVYPKGVRETRTVVVSEGQRVEACVEHLWKVSVGRGKRATTKVLRTDEIEALVARGVSVRLPRPVAPDLEGGDALPLDPYVLGVLLGDGNFPASGVRLTCNDPEIVADVAAHLPIGAKLVQYSPATPKRGASFGVVADGPGDNPVLTAVRALGLARQRAWEKHVPPAYLLGSAKQRHALLQGLLDTDGCIDVQGRVEFASSSEALARAVCDLVRSLGGRAAVRMSDDVTWTSWAQPVPQQGRPRWRVQNIDLPVDFPPFRLPRKAARVRVKAWARGHRIVAVEDAGPQEVACIAVSAPSHLYITDDWIVTHNTDAAGGRTGGRVMRHRRSLHNVAGFGYPPYAEEPAPTRPEEDPMIRQFGRIKGRPADYRNHARVAVKGDMLDENAVFQLVGKKLLHVDAAAADAFDLVLKDVPVHEFGKHRFAEIDIVQQ